MPVTHYNNILTYFWMFNYLKKNKMKKNMGKADKMIRILIAAVLAALYFANIITGTIAIVALTIALVFVLTSLVNFCPLYTLFGINTCAVKK